MKISSAMIKLIFITLCGACGSAPSGIKSIESSGLSNTTSNQKMGNDIFDINLSDEEWQIKLTPEQYYVLRNKGTEKPFTGKFEDHWDTGVYTCAGCGNELFQSSSKFDAGCGWPSFYEALDKSKIHEKVDYTHGMTRMEIMCAQCGGHLGHVFNDGPKNKTGLRYCVNSLSLDFVGKDSKNSK
jgi:peptide-methionine (R)-S-oxide reductase